jgi:hypothetical protein
LDGKLEKKSHRPLYTQYLLRLLTRTAAEEMQPAVGKGMAMKKVKARYRWHIPKVVNF